VVGDLFLQRSIGKMAKIFVLKHANGNQTTDEICAAEKKL
jgi:hypothetical protein